MKRFLLIIALTLFPLTSFAAVPEYLIGRIFLQVEANGEAWYVHPELGNRYYLKDGPTAYNMMRSFGLGITDADLAQIPAVEDTTGMNNSSTVCPSNRLANRVKGQILLQVQQRGEAWYVHPIKCRRIYMKDGFRAYDIMRYLGEGITNDDLGEIEADSIGENFVEFKQCTESNKYIQKIRDDFDEGVLLGARGTPTSFVNGEQINGALPIESFRQIFDNILEGSSDGDSNDSPVIRATDHYRGAQYAPITMVVFTDMECPFCARFDETVQQLLLEYSGDLKVVFKHMPLSSIHVTAEYAGNALECAGEIDKFWELHNEIFKIRREHHIDEGDILDAALLIGI